MSSFDIVISGIFALFIGIIMFIIVLPGALIGIGWNSVFAYLLGFICLGAVFLGFVKTILE